MKTPIQSSDKASSSRPSRWRVALLSAAVISAASVIYAGDLFVQPAKLDVREGPGLLFDPVDSVAKNDKLTEIERTDDGWIKVQTPKGKQGYVFKGSVSDKLASGPGIFSGSLTSDTEAAQMGTAAASKGLEPEADKYAASKSYSPANLNSVIAMNKAVKGPQWLQFCKDGNIGPSKPKK